MTPPRSRLRRLLGREGVLLGRVVLLFPLVRVAVWAVGFRRVLGVLGRLAPPAATGLTADEAAEREWWARRLLHLGLRWSLYRPNCLQRSIALWWLLRQYGLEGDFRIGARLRDGSLEAHAWVERGGRVLNDRQTIGQEYAPFSRDFASGHATFD